MAVSALSEDILILDELLRVSHSCNGDAQVSFAEEALQENIGAFVNALLLAKPAGLKKSK